MVSTRSVIDYQITRDQLDGLLISGRVDGAGDQLYQVDPYARHDGEDLFRGLIRQLPEQLVQSALLQTGQQRTARPSTAMMRRILARKLPLVVAEAQHAPAHLTEAEQRYPDQVLNGVTIDQAADLLEGNQSGEDILQALTPKLFYRLIADIFTVPVLVMHTNGQVTTNRPRLPMPSTPAATIRLLEVQRPRGAVLPLTKGKQATPRFLAPQTTPIDNPTTPPPDGITPRTHTQLVEPHASTASSASPLGTTGLQPEQPLPTPPSTTPIGTGEELQHTLGNTAGDAGSGDREVEVAAEFSLAVGDYLIALLAAHPAASPEHLSELLHGEVFAARWGEYPQWWQTAGVNAGQVRDLLADRRLRDPLSPARVIELVTQAAMRPPVVTPAGIRWTPVDTTDILPGTGLGGHTGRIFALQHGNNPPHAMIVLGGNQPTVDAGLMQAVTNISRQRGLFQIVPSMFIAHPSRVDDQIAYLMRRLDGVTVGINAEQFMTVLRRAGWNGVEDLQWAYGGADHAQTRPWINRVSAATGVDIWVLDDQAASVTLTPRDSASPMPGPELQLTALTTSSTPASWLRISSRPDTGRPSFLSQEGKLIDISRVAGKKRKDPSYGPLESGADYPTADEIFAELARRAVIRNISGPLPRNGLGVNVFKLGEPSVAPDFLRHVDQTKLTPHQTLHLFDSINLLKPHPTPGQLQQELSDQKALRWKYARQVVVPDVEHDRWGWAPEWLEGDPPRPELEPLPETAKLGIPLIDFSIWNGSILSPEGKSALFWQELERNVREYSDVMFVVSMDKLTRKDVAAALRQDQPPTDARGADIWHLTRWAQGLGIRLVARNEIFHAEQPMLSHEVQTARGHRDLGEDIAKRVDLERLELVYRFGGLYLDGNKRIPTIDWFKQVANSPAMFGYTYIGNAGYLAPARHPMMKAFLQAGIATYYQDQVDLIWNSAAYEGDLPLKDSSNERRTSTIPHAGPEMVSNELIRWGFFYNQTDSIPGGDYIGRSRRTRPVNLDIEDPFENSWLKPPNRQEETKLSRQDVMDLAVRMAAALIVDLSNLRGTLDFMSIEPMLNKMPKPVAVAVLRATLSYLASREDLRTQVTGYFGNRYKLQTAADNRGNIGRSRTYVDTRFAYLDTIREFFHMRPDLPPLFGDKTGRWVNDKQSYRAILLKPGKFAPSMDDLTRAYNTVRDHAGLPHLEDLWSDAQIVAGLKYLKKNKRKYGLGVKELEHANLVIVKIASQSFHGYGPGRRLPEQVRSARERIAAILGLVDYNSTEPLPVNGSESRLLQLFYDPPPERLARAMQAVLHAIIHVYGEFPYNAVTSTDLGRIAPDDNRTAPGLASTAASTQSDQSHTVTAGTASSTRVPGSVSISPAPPPDGLAQAGHAQAEATRVGDRAGQAVDDSLDQVRARLVLVRSQADHAGTQARQAQGALAQAWQDAQDAWQQVAATVIDAWTPAQEAAARGWLAQAQQALSQAQQARQTGMAQGPVAQQQVRARYQAAVQAQQHARQQEQAFDRLRRDAHGEGLAPSHLMVGAVQRWEAVMRSWNQAAEAWKQVMIVWTEVYTGQGTTPPTAVPSPPAEAPAQRPAPRRWWQFGGKIGGKKTAESSTPKPTPPVPGTSGGHAGTTERPVAVSPAPIPSPVASTPVASTPVRPQPAYPQAAAATSRPHQKPAPQPPVRAGGPPAASQPGSGGGSGDALWAQIAQQIPPQRFGHAWQFSGQTGQPPRTVGPSQVQQVITAWWPLLAQHPTRYTPHTPPLAAPDPAWAQIVTTQLKSATGLLGLPPAVAAQIVADALQSAVTIIDQHGQLITAAGPVSTVEPGAHLTLTWPASVSEPAPARLHHLVGTYLRSFSLQQALRSHDPVLTPVFTAMTQAMPAMPRVDTGVVYTQQLPSLALSAESINDLTPGRRIAEDLPIPTTTTPPAVLTSMPSAGRRPRTGTPAQPTVVFRIATPFAVPASDHTPPDTGTGASTQPTRQAAAAREALIPPGEFMITHLTREPGLVVVDLHQVAADRNPYHPDPPAGDSTGRDEDAAANDRADEAAQTATPASTRSDHQPETTTPTPPPRVRPTEESAHLGTPLGRRARPHTKHTHAPDPTAATQPAWQPRQVRSGYVASRVLRDRRQADTMPAIPGVLVFYAHTDPVVRTVVVVDQPDGTPLYIDKDKFVPWLVTQARGRAVWLMMCGGLEFGKALHEQGVAAMVVDGLAMFTSEGLRTTPIRFTADGTVDRTPPAPGDENVAWQVYSGTGDSAGASFPRWQDALTHLTGGTLQEGLLTEIEQATRAEELIIWAHQPQDAPGQPAAGPPSVLANRPPWWQRESRGTPTGLHWPVA